MARPLQATEVRLGLLLLLKWFFVQKLNRLFGEDCGIESVESHHNDAINIPEFSEPWLNFSRLWIGRCDP